MRLIYWVYTTLLIIAAFGILLDYIEHDMETHVDAEELEIIKLENKVLKNRLAACKYING